MDPLSDVLRVFQLGGAILFRAELCAPWSFAIPDAREMAGAILPDAGRLVRFHIVTAGSCVVELGGERLALGRGDVILLPRGEAHVMCSEPGLRPVPVLSVLPELSGSEVSRLVKPGPGPTTVILCGFLGCETPLFDPLFGALPSVIVARAERRQGSWFDALLRHMTVSAESAAPGDLGGQAMQVRLTELMFVEVVRRHVASLPPDRSGWLAALRDPCVGRAVAAIHAEPARDWSVASLAKHAGVSRSILAERFRRGAGVAPMQYLARWRLQVASGLLRSGDLSLAEAAARVGYRSEAAFSRAFKRHAGTSPAAWRDRVRRAAR